MRGINGWTLDLRIRNTFLYLPFWDLFWWQPPSLSKSIFHLLTGWLELNIAAVLCSFSLSPSFWRCARCPILPPNGDHIPLGYALVDTRTADYHDRFCLSCALTSISNGWSTADVQMIGSELIRAGLISRKYHDRNVWYRGLDWDRWIFPRVYTLSFGSFRLGACR